LPAEGNDRMLTGQDSNNMAFTERKKVGKRDTFPADDPVAIRECGRYGHH